MQYIIAPTSDYLEHSAKGSEWKKHKYIKKADGKYYYPDSYKGGRHLDTKHKAKWSNWLTRSSKKAKGQDNSKPMSADQRGKINSDLELPTIEEKDNKFFEELSDMTGMKEESFKELMQIAQSKGYDSEEYKELCNSLSEGDNDMYKKITNKLSDRILQKQVLDGGLKSDDEARKEADELMKQYKGNKETGSNDEDDGEYKLTEKDIDDLAKEALNGGLGDGELRKELLGNWYDDVQKRVNELSSKRKLKHGIEIPAYVIRPSDKMIFW